MSEEQKHVAEWMYVGRRFSEIDVLWSGCLKKARKSEDLEMRWGINRTRALNVAAAARLWHG